VSTGLAQSVQTRLVRHAKAIGVDPNLVLARYAAERLLYRLSRAPAELVSVIGGIAGFVGPVLAAAAGGPWQGVGS
jgi:hypothetical protein